MSSKSDKMENVTDKISEMDIAETGKKLTHKEKKKLKKQQEYERTVEILTKTGAQAHSELESNFTVSQSQTQHRGAQQLDNAVDIKVENFSIAAKGKELFTNASLLIAQGRRYGLVGPNGYVLLIFHFFHFKIHLLIKKKIILINFYLFSHGKTTLLRHIANKAFAIPPNIDILYCEQEVVADSTPAVEVVLNADVKCKELQKKCKELEEQSETGDESIQVKLQEVRI